MKRGQAQNQIFVYILGIIIIGAMFLIGFKFINSISATMRENRLNEFEREFTSSVEGIAYKPGMLRKETIPLDTKYGWVCVFDSECLNVSNTTLQTQCKSDINSNTNITDLPRNLILDSLESGVEKNVFLIEDTVEHSLFVEKTDVNHVVIDLGDNFIETDKRFVCVPNTVTGVKYMVRGTGDLTIFSDYYEEQ